jgi:hypothetical protein
MAKISHKSDFLSLIQDEEFFRLVIDNIENPQKLVDDLLKEHPEQDDSIRYAVEFIRLNFENKTKMGEEDYNRILDYIQKYSGKKKSPSYILSLVSFPIRIAATILLILSVGSLVIYKQSAKDPLVQFAQGNVSNGGQAMIVLSDGTTQVLKSNNSFIDYNSTDGEVIVTNEKENEIIGNSNKNENAVLNQVLVPFGQRHKVLLSDGTLVQLNAGSKLTFPATFSGKTREVYLKGEGFFDVRKNAKVPFIVKTDHIDIKVLGTTFNVSAYADEQFVTTVLVEGKVNVKQKDRMLANDEYILAPGQGCFYSMDTDKSVVRNVDTNNYVLWKDGLYNFKEIPLRDVVNRVHKYYNLTIQIEGERLANTLVSGKLVLSEDPTEVMEYLSKTMEGRYEKTTQGSYILKQ